MIGEEQLIPLVVAVDITDILYQTDLKKQIILISLFHYYHYN